MKEEARGIPAVADVLKELEDCHEKEQKSYKAAHIAWQRQTIVIAIKHELKKAKQQIVDDVWSGINSKFSIEVTVEIKGNHLFDEIRKELEEQGWKDISFEPIPDGTSGILSFSSHDLIKEIFEENT